jgi:hypothetical protein
LWRNMTLAKFISGKWFKSNWPKYRRKIFSSRSWILSNRKALSSWGSNLSKIHHMTIICCRLVRVLIFNCKRRRFFLLILILRRFT